MPCFTGLFKLKHLKYNIKAININDQADVKT